MNLSSDLTSLFAKAVKNQDDKKVTESKMYGTVVEKNGKQYVQLDGSEQLTPISSTTTVVNGERVSVSIKNHTAIVTGNVTSPAARTDDVKELGNKISEFDIVIADKVSTKELEVERGRIDTLVSDNVTIKETLTANSADISDLEADNVTINEKLEANEASIKKLDAEKITANQADLKYATIANLEATNADIYNLEATYGEFSQLTTEKLEANEASIKKLETDKLDTNQLSAEVAKLGYAEVEDLNAANAKITNLETDKLSTKDLSAEVAKLGYAEIDDLNATNAKIENLDASYANIDFSNIQMAAVEELFTKSGIIKDLVVGDQSITGELVGVTIKGDLIEAGTLKADRLVVKGSDGNYYKLNTDFEAMPGVEPVEEDAIHGSVLVANSITATKIDVDDLVAFDATIGGFKITEDSIYSGVKESVDNTTRGIYLDNDGQIAFGNASQYVKFYKVSDGVYKLAIAADGIFIGDEQKNVEEYMEEVKQSAQANAEDLTNYISTTNKELENLQGQIDGSIMTWFYEYVPTNDNEPASDWTTTDLKNNHLGDLFYDTITGYCYRWQVQNNQYFWTRITDVDITKALADAKAAQDTADNKRRVFVSTPTPPYDIGDLWTQGTGGDLMRCQTAKTANQSYAAADWVKASKYTDDTTANVVKADVNALTTRVTNAETSITKTNEEIALRATKTEVTEAIDNIEIGGRNLLPHSKLDVDSSNWKYGNVTSNFEDGYLKLTKAETTARGYCNQNGISLPQVGRYYTVSIDAMKLPDVDIPADTSVFIRYVLNETVFAELIIRIPTDLSEGVWTKLSNTFLYDDEIPSYVQATIALGKPAGGLALRHFKYEMGNKATDWTPAPEDMASKTEMTSAITQSADSIKMEVSETYTTKEEFGALEIGGRNLLANSDFLLERLSDATNILGTNRSVVSSHLKDMVNRDVVFSYYVHCPGERVTTGTNAQMANRFGMHGVVRWSDSTGVKTSTQVAYPFSGKLEIRTEHERIFMTTKLTPPSGYDTIDLFNIQIQGYAKPAEEGVRWLIGYPKLEYGTKATDWTPAPEDMASVTEMNSAIEQKADSIKLEVSKTYTPKDEFNDAFDIHGTANGSPITISDSADAQLEGLKVYGKSEQNKISGKNLLENIAITQTVNGITFTINSDGSVTANGTATALAGISINANVPLAIGNYIISDGVGDYTNYFTQVIVTAGDGTQSYYNTGAESNFSISEGDSVKVVVYVRANVTVSKRTFYPMIRLASVTDATYEPYTGGVASPNPDYPQEIMSVENPVVVINGKNLLENKTTTRTVSGVTFTVDSNGSIKANGTATANVSLVLNNKINLSPGNYIVSGGKETKARLEFRATKPDGSTTGGNDVGSGVNVTVTDDVVSSKVTLVIINGTTFSDHVFYPMIRHASIEDSTYEPYKSQSMSIATTKGLNGIPVTSGGNYTDANGQMWIADELDFERGVKVQRIATWQYDSSYKVEAFNNKDTYEYQQFNIVGPTLGQKANKLSICNAFEYNSLVTSGSELGFALYSSNIVVVGVPKTLLESYGFVDGTSSTYAPSFKAWAAENPITIFYALATPIETLLTNEEIASFKSLRAYYPNTTISNEDGADMSVDYRRYTKAVDFATTTEMSSAIKVESDSITSTVSAKYTTKDEFNKLELGGRNYIRGSSGDWSEWITPEANSDNVCYTPVNAYLSEDETEVGDPFMCSFEVEFSGVSAGTGGAFRFIPQGAMDDGWDKGQLWYGIFITEPPADGIYRYEMKRSITERQVGTVKVGCGFRCDYWDGVGKYRIRRMKLERGNKATAWTPAPEDVDADISEVHEAILEQNTSITQTCNDIVLEATSTCVQNEEYEAYKESVQLQIDGQNNEIAMNFATTSQQIADADANNQAKFAEIEKHITFSDNGITITSGENGIVLEIDNDGISFRRSDSTEPFGFWDGNEFLTGNIFVKTNEQARLGGFAYLPRADGSLMFKKVGD